MERNSVTVCFSFNGQKEGVPLLRRKPHTPADIPVWPLGADPFITSTTSGNDPVYLTVAKGSAGDPNQLRLQCVFMHHLLSSLSVLEKLQYSWGLQPKAVCEFILAHTVDMKMIQSPVRLLFVCTSMHLLTSSSSHLTSKKSHDSSPACFDFVLGWFI